MITFLYCCICLLIIVCCQTTGLENQDDPYTNDFPPNTMPKMERFRQKIGTDLLMKCKDRHHYNEADISWDFKSCTSNYYKGIQCDDSNIYKLDSTDSEWKKLDFSKSRQILELKNVTEENIGMYRCLYNESIIKIYVVDVIVGLRHNELPPKVAPLILSSNSTMLPLTNLVIQCKMTSIIPPEVRWFKECSGRKCVSNISDIQSNGCYCLIPNSNFVYSNGSDVYFSKLSIYNLRTIDSGMYICLALSAQGHDQSNITIKVQDQDFLYTNDKRNRQFSFSLLFLIPLCFMLVPLTIWLCFYRRKKKQCILSEQHKQQLIKVDIVCRS